MNEAIEDLRAESDDRRMTVIGVGGTVATLAQVNLGHASFERSAIEGHEIKRVKLGSVTARLAGRTPEERVQECHVKEGRKEYIVGGAALVCGLMDVLNVPGFRCTCRGLRHGLLIHELDISTDSK